MAASIPSTTTAPGTTHLDPLSSSQPSAERPLEMTDLEASKGGSHDLNDVQIPTTSPLTSHFPAPTDEGDIASGSAGPAVSTGHTISAADASTDSAAKEAAAATSNPVVSPLSAPSPPETGNDTIVSAAGGATSPTSGDKEMPVLVITLLLTSGARHPYKIDEKYLTKRNVTIPGTTESGAKDPFSISIYTLKELILREWRDEWEAQPSSPSSIRLIYFGRLLDDKAVLKGMLCPLIFSHMFLITNGVTAECRFNSEATNVIHMTVRPQDVVDEEDASKAKGLGRDREGGEATSGCRCVIL